MPKNILIIEDTPNDIKYYQSLFIPEREVSLLFLTRDKNYTKEKLSEIVGLFYENLSSKIKDYFVHTEETIQEFLKNNPFDFYILDSLGDFAEQLVTEVNLPKEKVAFLSSTKSFRDLIQNKGYRAYKKENINELIKNCF